MRLVLIALATLFNCQAFATVDGHDRVFLVGKDIQSEEFFLERAPIIGCYGLPQGARLIAWTSEYKVPSNIGCGGPAFADNLNALSCAKLISATESKDYMSFSDITLDISKCPDKNNAQFITMVRTSAARNFPQSNTAREVVLRLIK